MRAEAVLAIPNDAAWPTASFDQICSLVSRGTAPQYVERSEVRAIGQRCVAAAGFEPSFARPHSTRAMNGVLVAEAGDVLLNSTGTGTIGRSCVFLGEGTFIVDGHVTVLRSRPGRSDGRWLNALLRTPWGQNFLETQCYAGSTNQVELSRTRLASARAPIPPVSEQRQIAAIVDTIDGTIRKTEQIIAKLKQVKQGLLHDLLTRGIDDNGELRDPERHPEQFKDSPRGHVPARWSVAPLKDRVDVRGGKRLPAGHAFAAHETPYRYLHTTDFIGREVDYPSMTYIEPPTFRALERYEITGGHLYISIAGVNLGYAGVFRPTISDRTILTENAAKLILRAGDLPEFVTTQINGTSVQQQIAVEKGVGAGVPKLALFRIEQLMLAWPAADEQREIHQQVRAAETLVIGEEEALRKLRLLKAGLAEALLTGRVRVTKLLESAAP